MHLPGGTLYVNDPKPSGWTHVVLRLRNANSIQMYFNGEEVDSDTTLYPVSHPAGYGRIIIGKYGTTYASVGVYFNSSLSNANIQALFNSS